MRFILAIDTAFSACNLALLDLQSGTSVKNTILTERGQAEKLVPMIDELVAAANITYPQIDLVAVTVGPGSFTGLRVGIATARGFGLALNRPVQGVRTTDALYATWVAQGGTGDVTVMINTKRNDAYAVSYSAGQADQVRIIGPEVISSTKDPIIGDGVDLIPLYGGRTDILRLPDPEIIARLAFNAYTDMKNPDRGLAEPLYIRDAEVSQPKRHGRIPLDPDAVR